MSDHNRLVEQQSVYQVGALAGKLGYLFRPVKDHDKGVDAELEITQSVNVVSPIIGIQIKGRTGVKPTNQNEISITVTEQNLYYWKKYGRPVILVIYLGSEDKIYWTRVDNVTTKTIKVSLHQKFDKTTLQSFSRILSQYYNEMARDFSVKETSEILEEIGATFSEVVDPVEKRLQDAKIYINQKQFKQAAQIYSSLANIYENTISIWYNWAVCLFECQEYTNARVVLEKILQKHPENVEVYFLLGLCLADLGEYEVAEKYLSDCIKKSPLRADIWNGYGLLHYWQGRNEEAFQEFSQATFYEPNDENYQFNLALCLTALERYDDALECYDKCIFINPDFYDAYNNKASLLKELWRLWEALEWYDRAIDLQPNNHKALGNSAFLLKDLGYNERAIQRYYRALEIIPHTESIHQALGLLYCRLDEISKAEFHFSKAFDLSDPSGTIEGKIGHLDLGYTVTYAITLERKQKSVYVLEIEDVSNIALFNQPNMLDILKIAVNTNSPGLPRKPKDRFVPKAS